MIKSHMRCFYGFCKSFLPGLVLVVALMTGAAGLSGCTVNPATGGQQFTALMSPAQESRIGAQEHDKIVSSYGALPADDRLARYVEQTGQGVAADTERPDVRYRFFVLDSPMVNAFALPGGYVYVTRGLLAQANSEAELAAVLGHEVGHVTGRHSAERYSQSVVTSLGGALLSAALDSRSAAQAIGLGTNLYLSSYSRGQEHEADELGIRYLHRAGYDPEGMAWFLANLEAQSSLEARLNGAPASGGASDFFATHPRTADRVSRARGLAAAYPPNEQIVRRDEYLRMVDGMVYGDSARQGFVRGRDFYHPEIGFTFSVPEGYRMSNQPEQIVATGPGDAVMIFDSAPNPQNLDPRAYLAGQWMRGQELQTLEEIEINGMRAATAAFSGRINNAPVTIRLVAVQWAPGTFLRFQVAIPQGATSAMIEDLRRATYSLRRMTEREKNDIRPWRLQVVTAGPNDTVRSLASRMPFERLPEERFRTLNGLSAGQEVTAGRLYKVVSER